MNNHSEQNDLVLRGESGMLDKSALVCDLVMLGIFLWNQLYYGMDMLPLIILLALIGAYLFLFCILTEEYCFTREALLIRHPLRRTVSIPYDAMFNFETTVHDSFINIGQSNKVKLYHTAGKTKRLTICRPKDIMTFAEQLKLRCPEFQAEEKDHALNVFFETENKPE